MEPNFAVILEIIVKQSDDEMAEIIDKLMNWEHDMPTPFSLRVNFFFKV